VRVGSLVVLAAASAHASPRVHHVGARDAYVRARTECDHPGARLARLVERRFSPPAFAALVASDWLDRTDPEREALEALADRVVGHELRARAIAELCAAATIESVDVTGDGVWITVRRRDETACDPERQHLMFHDEDGTWRYDGVWFCGVSTRPAAWRSRYGPDYAYAIERLRAEAVGEPVVDPPDRADDIVFEPAIDPPR